MDNILLASPEIFLSIATLFILMVGTFFDCPKTCTFLAVFAVIGCFFMIIAASNPFDNFFYQLFVWDEYGFYIKLIILTFAGFVLLASAEYTVHIKQFEYSVLVLLSLIGMMFMVSVNNFIALYMVLELTSFPIYILTTVEKRNHKSSEAGMKYFILGSVASGIFLYGCSLIYGVNGGLGFDLISQNANTSIASIIGMVLIISGIAFKLSAVPFHMWTPDVYEGSPTAVTIMISTLPKLAAAAMLIRVLLFPFGYLAEYWQEITLFLGVLSVAVGTFGALWQKNIKRLLAYSAITNLGYVMLGISVGTVTGIQGVIMYITIYTAASLGAFSFVLMMRKDNEDDINSMAGLAKENPRISMGMAVIMLSMASLPPFGGFFGKVYIFIPLMESGYYGVAVFGILMSVIAAFYYLRVIKIMYIDQQTETKSLDDEYEDGSYVCACTACAGETTYPLRLAPAAAVNRAVFFISSGFLALFFVYPSWLIKIAETVAKAVF